MSAETWDHAYAWIRRAEGGYVNDSQDPGGPTMAGVTQRTYDAHRHRVGLPPRPVRGVTEDELATIYREIWDGVHGDDLPAGVDLVTFDAAVHSGPFSAARWLQEAVQVPTDGVVGPVTVNAVAGTPSDQVIVEVLDLRLHALAGLPGWQRFGVGWVRRLLNLQSAALRCCRCCN